jgi:hypothetical protein
VTRGATARGSRVSCQAPRELTSAYRARLNRCEGRPMVPEERVPVPRRCGSMARRKVSFCRVFPAGCLHECLGREVM